MTGVQDRHIIFFCHFIDRRKQAFEILFGIDILLAVGGKQDVSALFQTEPCMDIRPFDLIKVIVQDLCHRRAGHIGALLRQSRIGKITPCVLRIRQIDVGDDVDDPAVGFLRQALVLTTVARFHMKNRDMQTLRTDNG